MTRGVGDTHRKPEAGGINSKKTKNLKKNLCVFSGRRPMQIPLHQTLHQIDVGSGNCNESAMTHCRRPLQKFMESRSRFFLDWFLGSLEEKTVELGWGRDLGRPERIYVPAKSVSEEKLGEIYSRLESEKRPVFQSVNYYCFSKPFSPGRLIALEKVFIDIDSPGDLSKAREEARKLCDHLQSYCKPLLVFSGSKGYHVYFWLPRAEENTELYKYIVKVLGIKKLGLKYIDLKVVEDRARVARVPYTLHQKTGRIVMPLDYDFSEILPESFSLGTYIKNSLPRSVLEEAEQYMLFLEDYYRAKRFLAVLEALKNPRETVRSPELPAVVRYILEKGVSEGCRNNAAFIIATYLYKKGYGFEETLEELLKWNKKNRPPLPERELVYVVKSVYRHRYRPPSRKKIQEWLGDKHS